MQFYPPACTQSAIWVRFRSRPDVCTFRHRAKAASVRPQYVLTACPKFTLDHSLCAGPPTGCPQLCVGDRECSEIRCQQEDESSDDRCGSVNKCLWNKNTARWWMLLVHLCIFWASPHVYWILELKQGWLLVNSLSVSIWWSCICLAMFSAVVTAGILSTTHLNTITALRIAPSFSAWSSFKCICGRSIFCTPVYTQPTKYL